MLQGHREGSSTWTGGIKKGFKKEGTSELRKKREVGSSRKEEQMQRKGRRRNKGEKVNKGWIMEGLVGKAMKSGLP